MMGVALLGAAAACRQLVGIGDSPPTTVEDAGTAPETGPRCGVAFAGEDCETCLEKNCCGFATSCAKSQACKPLADCTGGCGGEPGCIAGCIAANPVANDEPTPLFDACMAKNCSDKCHLTCSVVSTFGAEPDAAAQCVKCIQGVGGCEALAGCESDRACQAEQWCAAYATTFDTQYACGQLFDGGADGSALGSALSQCGKVSCGAGTKWSCVGHVTMPPALSPSITLHLRLFDSAAGKAVPGVTARLCTINDPPCDNPIGDGGVSDPDGEAVLVFPAQSEVIYVDLAGGGIIPEAFFPSAILTEPQAYLGSTVYAVTPKEAQYIATELGIAFQPGTGSVAVQGFDCTLSAAVGVQFSIAPAGASHIFYFNGGVSPDDAGLTSQGLAAVLNAPAGQLSVTMTPVAPSGPSTTVNFFVRDGGASVVWIPPR
jgi:hypothetical protein